MQKGSCDVLIGCLTSQTVLAILGGLPKRLRRATVSFAMSVGPSVNIELFSSRWTNFREILYCRFLQKLGIRASVYDNTSLNCSQVEINSEGCCRKDITTFHFKYIYPESVPFTRNLQGIR